MPFARASSLDRVLACPGSLLLPLDTEDSRGPNVMEAAEWGTDMHTFLHTGKVPQGRFYDEMLKRVEYFPRKKMYPLGGIHEQAFSLDVLTEELEVYHGPHEGVDEWKESRGPDCVTGSADYEADLLGTPWVDDLKTGRAYNSPKGAQLGFYGLCVWIRAGRPDCGAVTSITAFTRRPPKSDPKREFHTWTPMALLELLGKLKDAAKKTDKTLAVGPQCTYCPSKLGCPA